MQGMLVKVVCNFVSVMSSGSYDLLGTVLKAQLNLTDQQVTEMRQRAVAGGEVDPGFHQLGVYLYDRMVYAVSIVQSAHSAFQWLRGLGDDWIALFYFTAGRIMSDCMKDSVRSLQPFAGQWDVCRRYCIRVYPAPGR